MNQLKRNANAAKSIVTLNVIFLMHLDSEMLNFQSANHAIVKEF